MNNDCSDYSGKISVTVSSKFVFHAEICGYCLNIEFIALYNFEFITLSNIEYCLFAPFDRVARCHP